MTGSQYVTVAVSRDPENAAPISGFFVGPPTAFQGIQVDVTVVQIDKPELSLSSSRHQSPSLQPQPVPQAQQMPQQNPATMDMVIQAAPEPSAQAVS